MAKKAKPTKKGDQLTVDFSGVESGGAPRLPEGDYIAKVKSVNKTTAESSGATMLKWEWEITEGKHKGKVIRDNTVLTPKALWRLKKVLEALGVEVPDSALKLNLKSYVGETCGITIVDGEPYQGRIKSEIGDFIDESVVTGDDVDDEDEDEDDDLDDDEDEDDDL